eukprot:scaffold25909_cov60-Phaeocystis_antarctica.AAC.3
MSERWTRRASATSAASAASAAATPRILASAAEALAAAVAFACVLMPPARALCWIALRRAWRLLMERPNGSSLSVASVTAVSSPSMLKRGES